MAPTSHPTPAKRPTLPTSSRTTCNRWNEDRHCPYTKCRYVHARLCRVPQHHPQESSMPPGRQEGQDGRLAGSHGPTVVWSHPCLLYYYYYYYCYYFLLFFLFLLFSSCALKISYICILFGWAHCTAHTSQPYTPTHQALTPTHRSHIHSTTTGAHHWFVFFFCCPPFSFLLAPCSCALHCVITDWFITITHY